MDDIQKLKKEYDDYAYIVSHDLGAPLRQVKAFFELFLDDIVNLTEDQKSYRDLMFSSLGCANDILDGLLRFSRLNDHNLNCEKVELSEFFKTITSECGGADVTTSNTTQFVMADRDLLVNIFDEILGNSKKFRDSRRPLSLKIDANIDDESTILKIKDNGIGVESEYCKAIFDPMRTLHVKSKYEGCGMGLTLCKKMMDLHDGEIWAEPNEGAGLSIYLKFPQ